MKLKDLLNEVRIFQHNFIKTDVVGNELKMIFGDEAPAIEFDNDGLFIIMDIFQTRKYEESFEGIDIEDRKFFLSDGGFMDDLKSTKKYYIEFTRPLDDEEDTPGEDSEEKPAPEAQQPALAAG
jgi:hypothetical protein